MSLKQISSYPYRIGKIINCWSSEKFSQRLCVTKVQVCSSESFRPELFKVNFRCVTGYLNSLAAAQPLYRDRKKAHISYPMRIIAMKIMRH